MWKAENRQRYNRDKLRYPSDLTDQEWWQVEGIIPPARRAPAGGRRAGDRQRRHVCAEHRLRMALRPRDLPPSGTINGYLQRWAYDGTLDNLHYELYQKCREQAEREASPTACIIDSQSVKSAEKVGSASIPKAMTPARKSAARSAISWSIPRAC